MWWLVSILFCLVFGKYYYMAAFWALGDMYVDLYRKGRKEDEELHQYELEKHETLCKLVCQTIVTVGTICTSELIKFLVAQALNMH